MIRLSRSRSKCRDRWRAAAAIAGAILAAGGTFAVSPSAMADGPTAAPPGAVEAGLGVRPVRAEIVILVDISSSMSPGTGDNDLYPRTLSELRVVLSELAGQEPYDTVAVIEFTSSARQIYDGSPGIKAIAGLPANATQVGTDVGAAFQQAITTLTDDVRAKGIQAGSVLLLSDGQIHASSGSAYQSYSSPGWSQLATMMKHLPVPVTGYGSQLSANTYQLPTALQKVFGNPVYIAKNTTDLTGELEMPGRELLDSEIARAVAPDAGQGVRVAWSGLPGGDGSKPVNMTSAGHMQLKITLTATTSRVPLYLTGLSVKSSNLPGAAISGTLPSADLMLSPGQQVTLPVQLTWQPRPNGVSFTGAPQTRRGRTRAYRPRFLDLHADDQVLL